VSAAETLDHGWWLASRSAGIVAYLLLSASVVLGLAMALRLAPPRATALLRTAHERIALIALGVVAAHALFLLGDGWLRPGLTDVLVPFTMAYRPAWTGLGILAFYLTAGLSLTYYARRRIGARRWRTAHRVIPVAWAMAAVHVIGAGTDAGSLWLQVPLALTMALVIALVGQRLLDPGAGRAVRAPRRVPVPVAVPAAATPPAAATAARATAPTQPMGIAPPWAAAAPEDEAVTAVAPRDDEAITTVAPPAGYWPLWVRRPSA
jgi:methionine sulfoxide reductase heme-binding subunit